MRQGLHSAAHGAVSLRGNSQKNAKPGSCAESGFGILLMCENKKRKQVAYTAYETEYQVCLLTDIGIIIPSDEPVRLLSAVAEELDYRRLTATHSRLGRIEY